MAEDGVEVKLARIEERLANIQNQLAQFASLLMGVDGKPGIVVRLDRIEQAEGKRSKFLWLALGAALTALGKSVGPW
jgi:hypothetical protein